MNNLKTFSIIAALTFVLMATGFILTGGQGTPLSLLMAAPFALVVVGLVGIALYNAVRKR